MCKRPIILFIFFILSFCSFSQFTIYDQFNSGLTDGYCWYVNQDQAGKVWVGTQSSGAFVYDIIWKNYNTSNSGIASNVITPIIFDNGGLTWLASCPYSNSGGLTK